jgi:hypothetical protein
MTPPVRVLIQPPLQLIDLLLERPDRGRQFGRLCPQRKNQGSGFTRQTVPRVGREWRARAH